MNNLHEFTTALSDDQKIDMILRNCAEDFLETYDGKKAVTLKEIYGLHFWLMMTPAQTMDFGLRFSIICQDLGFKNTDEERNKANLYIKK